MQAEEYQKWVRGVREPFEGGRERFAAVPKKDRSEFTKKILQTKQLPTPPPYSHEKPFPNEADYDVEGHRLHYYSIESTPTPIAIVVFIHGVNSHGNTFGYLAHKISQENQKVNFYAYDQTNFGQSAGTRRGLVVSLEDSAKQAQRFIAFLLERFQQKPKVFLCGHSFGGAISVKLSLMTPSAYSGMILLTPYLKDIQESFYYTKRALKFVGWLFPNYQISKSVPSGLGTKYTLTQKFLKDPNIFTGAIVPATIRATLNASDQIYPSLEKVTTPFLCLAAGVEKLLDPFAALDLQERSGAVDKRVIYCEGMWHVVVEEEEIDGVAWHCSQWLQERA